MLCLICWVARRAVKWVIDPTYHQHVSGHAPVTAADPLADALLSGQVVLTHLVLPDGVVVIPVTESTNLPAERRNEE